MTVPPCPAPAPVAPATIAPQPQPAPRPGSRSFSVPLITGGVFQETCPPGCVHDHASDMRGAFVEDLYHRLSRTVSTEVSVFDADEGTVELPILAAHLQVDPYSADPRLRVPHAVLEPAPDDVMDGLSPVELRAAIAQVREHLVVLDGLCDQLEAARAGYGRS